MQTICRQCHSRLKLLIPWLASILAACSGTLVQGNENVPAWEPDPRPLARTLVYECPGHGDGGYDFMARLGPGEMALWLEDGYLILSRVRSASGVKYMEGDVVFWMKGNEASLALGPDHHTGCVLVPERAPWEDARRRGVDFRAVGNEPGWYLELSRNERILYVGAYGTLRVEFSEPSIEQQNGVRIYNSSVENHQLRVEIIEGVCTDSMKGSSFPYQVMLQLDGASYQGCGKDLKPIHDQAREST